MKIKKIIFLIAIMPFLIHASPISVSDGGTGDNAAVAYAVLCGGTTNVGPLQFLVSVGSSGQPIVSNGAGALPSFQTLPISGGGTNTTSLSAGVIQSDGSVLSSLGVGSDSQVLKDTSGVVGWAYTGLLQVASTSTGARISTTGTSIPNDDTIPQFSEGTLILSLSFTPKSASSTLLIIFSTNGTHTASTPVIAALFVDSGSNAIAAQYLSQRLGGPSDGAQLQTLVASGSTTTRTYQIRVGGGDFQINSGSSSQKFGGVASTVLTVMEFA